MTRQSRWIEVKRGQCFAGKNFLLLKSKSTSPCHLRAEWLQEEFALAPIHPTTYAIAAGLLGIKLPQGDRLAFIADQARRIVDRCHLPDCQAWSRAAAEGWDLGIRSTGTFREEIAASRRYEETNLRLIVTALFDQRLRAGWTFLWSVQNEGSSVRTLGALYPNGTALSFADACHAAGRAAEESLGL